jgi:hypothetical protein
MFYVYDVTLILYESDPASIYIIEEAETIITRGFKKPWFSKGLKMWL